MVMTQTAKRIFKALGNDIRLSIVGLLIKKGEVSCQELQKHFTLSQSTMSHHFNELLDVEILKARKDGPNHFYSLNNKLLNRYGVYLNGKEARQ